MATLGTAIYRLVARGAATQLGRLGFVQGVHARRSLASGEISFGRSDIDFTVVIDPSESMDVEVERMRALVRRLDILHLAVPMLGPPEVATPAELEDWYRSPILPASSHRDRGWLRLWGKPFTPPAVSGSQEDEREGALPWFFWTWLTLARDYRRGRVRTCCSIEIHLDAPSYADLPAVPAAFFTPRNVCFRHGERTYIDYFGQALAVFDRDACRCVVHGIEHDIVHEIVYLTVLSTVGQHLDRRGLHRLHALGVSYRYRGILLLLPSGGGKGSVAASRLYNGLRLLARAPAYRSVLGRNPRRNYDTLLDFVRRW